MSPSEAQEVLRQFLEDGVANVDIVRAHAEAAGVNCDYSLETLPAFLRWSFSQMNTVPREANPKVPEWIRATEDYQKGLFDFDDRSKDLICFTAYYFGECFIRNYPNLRWATGNCDAPKGVVNADANMPVVTGFAHNIEMASMSILENVFARLVAHPERSQDIDIMIDSWCKYIC
jgi:hypothetical protein